MNQEIKTIAESFITAASNSWRKTIKNCKKR